MIVQGKPLGGPESSLVGNIRAGRGRSEAPPFVDACHHRGRHKRCRPRHKLPRKTVAQTSDTFGISRCPTRPLHSSPSTSEQSHLRGCSRILVSAYPRHLPQVCQTCTTDERTSLLQQSCSASRTPQSPRFAGSPRPPDTTILCPHTAAIQTAGPSARSRTHTHIPGDLAFPQRRLGLEVSLATGCHT